MNFASFNQQINKVVKIRLPKFVLLALAILILGTIGGYYFTKKYDSAQEKALWQQVGPRRANVTGYKFISPLLSYTMPESVLFGEYKPLESEIVNIINDAKKNNTASQVSVYFRDSSNGRWTGVNENDKYYPASLFKVVVMIAYLKQAETDPSLLNKVLLYSKNEDESITDIPFQAPSTLKVGQNYSIEQLLENMIIYSDNGAKNLLLDNINIDSLKAIFSDLNIPYPDNSDTDYTISAKTYSLFFSVLYNSTYLNEQMSEKALSLLSQAKYTDGLVAGLPKEIVVAQKFGEHILPDDTGLELHNCGIIYAPKNPYTLCVMTKGTNYNQLAKIISSISQTAYEEVTSNYSANRGQ